MPDVGICVVTAVIERRGRAASPSVGRTTSNEPERGLPPSKDDEDEFADVIRHALSDP